MRTSIKALLVLLLGLLVYAVLVSIGLLPSPRGATLAGDVAGARSDRPGHRVLFVGNSFTFQNSMPRLVRQLAEEDPQVGPVFVVEYTAGSRSLRQFARDDDLAQLIEDIRWDHVVLQERSYIPALPAERRRNAMDAPARTLHTTARTYGAETVLFMTWAYRDGDRITVRGDTYADMQARVAQGYRDLAVDLPARVAPVGLAWAEAMRRQPTLELWAEDGRHPNRAGSYLAACVFYAVLFGADPTERSFAAELNPDVAEFLQDVAADVALDG